MNDPKQIFSLFTEKVNLFPIFHTAQRQLTNFQEIRIVYKKGKNLSTADMLNRFFTQKELQLNQLKNKKLPPHIHFAKLTFDNQITLVHYLIKHELYFLQKRMIVILFWLTSEMNNSPFIIMTKRKTS